jgi:hypothetical protein
MKGTLIMEAAIATVIFSVVGSTYGLVSPATSAAISITRDPSPAQVLSLQLPMQP